MEIEFRLIKEEAPFLVQDERLDYVESFGYGPDMAYSQALHSSSGLELAFFVRLNRQGLLEDIERKQSQLIKLSENNLSIVKKLRQITNKLSSTVITDDERYELVLQRDLLERKIYRILPKINSQIVDANIISKKLPPKSILIEFQKYYPHKPLSKSEERWGDPRYIALLLYDDGKSKSFDLGLAEPIELKIREALRASEEMLINAQDLWNEVGKLIIAPLENLLGEAETIFISPDAELNRVPFSSISSHVDKELFGEAINLRILTTGRELLTLFDKSENSYKQALVIANPNFDNKKELVLRKEEFLLDLPNQSRSMDLESVVWNQLPGTSREGKEIAKLTDAKYLTKEKATALAIQKYNSPRILHIASHAYYMTNQDELENPLLRSGIVLAGANQPDLNPYDDGYLTALEVTKLDLEGTELAVISGCESGKGDFQSGEGVYGLKRALAVAGSRSSLLSLWKVDDYGTALFMESFYEKLKEGKSRSKALSDTQKEFREHPLPGFRHPGIWAAFVLSGDWRQIKF